ncbi:MAG: CaiB/BaiF CoA-transferase family protein [Sporolactobacillus sp.]
MNKPLKGLKVLELATYVAGPACTRALADWGADVIKVENPNGDALRRVGFNTKMPTDPEENPCFDLSNMGKRGIVINLKSDEGKHVMDKLLVQADIFVTNNRTKSLKKMGMDYETLKERFPRLIYAQSVGYGEKGALKDTPGFDFTSYYARGGLLGTFYEKGTSPINPVPQFGDNQVAMELAAGILAAVYRRQTTGLGDKVTVSLYHAAIYDFNLVITSSQYGFNYPISRKDAGNPFLNTYPTKDGRWLQLACPEYDRMFPKVMQAIDRTDLIDNDSYNNVKAITGHTREMIEIVEQQMMQRTVNEWLEIFAKFDIPCEKAYLWEEILDDPEARENDFIHEMHYKTGNVRKLVDTPVKFSSMPSVTHARGPKFGEHTKEVMETLGYSEDQIKEMVDHNVIIMGS